MDISFSRRAALGSLLAGMSAPALALARHPGVKPMSDHAPTLPPDANACVELVHSGTATPRELAAASIKRIEALNPQLNAVVSERFDRALAEADKVDRKLPLAGVPLLLKDVALEGEKFYIGNKAYAEADWRFPVTDHFTRRLQQAGAVVLGYTNVPEFLSAATTESRLYGPCHNPWDHTRSVGGSSGGSAAAVASLMVPAAQSSDGGGSSRIPASANGLFTIKPSRGRTPLTPSATDWTDITSSKSFETRTVRDFALLLDVVASVDRTETIGAQPPARPFVHEVAAPPGRLRIGFARTGGGSTAPCHPENLKALNDAAALLQSLGHHVEEAAPATFLSQESFAIILGYWPLKVASRAGVIEEKIGRKLTEADMEPDSFAMLQMARQQSVADFSHTLAHIRDFTARSLAWWNSYDVLLTPTTGSPPPLLGAMSAPGAEGRAVSTLWGRFAPYANITGQPAASVPLHWTPDGLPLGVQLVGDVWREDLLIRLAAQLEAARPWAGRYAKLL